MQSPMQSSRPVSCSASIYSGLPGGFQPDQGSVRSDLRLCHHGGFPEPDRRHPRRAQPRTRGLHVSGRFRRQHFQYADPGKPDLGLGALSRWRFCIGGAGSWQSAGVLIGIPVLRLTRRLSGNRYAGVRRDHQEYRQTIFIL